MQLCTGFPGFLGSALVGRTAGRRTDRGRRASRGHAPVWSADENTWRALPGTGVTCPLFEACVDTLVAYVRERPAVDDAAMA